MIHFWLPMQNLNTAKAVATFQGTQRTCLGSEVAQHNHDKRRTSVIHLWLPMQNLNMAKAVATFQGTPRTCFGSKVAQQHFDKRKLSRLELI